MALVLPPPTQPTLLADAPASDWTSAAAPPVLPPSSSSSTSSTHNALELTLDATSTASFLTALSSTSSDDHARPLSPPPSPPRPDVSRPTSSHRRKRSTEERLAELDFTAIPWLSGREEDDLNLVGGEKQRGEEGVAGLMEQRSWQAEEGRRRERRNSWEKKKKEKKDVHAQQLPPSPPTTPPGLEFAFPSTTSWPRPPSRWERSPTASSSSPLSPPPSPAKPSPSSSFSASPPHRHAVRSSLPPLRTQLSPTGYSAAAACLPSPPSSTSSLPLSSAIPSSPRRRSSSLPTLAPIVIPVPSPAKKRTTRSQMRRPLSPPSSPPSPLSAASSPSSSPTSLRSRSPALSSKRRAARKPEVADGGAALSRGRSVTKKALTDNRSSAPSSASASLSSTARHRRSGATSIYTLPLSPPSLTPPPPPSKPARASPVSLPAIPAPPPPPARRPLLDLDPNDPELDERFQSLPVLRLRHALSVQASLATYRERAASSPTKRSSASAGGVESSKASSPPSLASSPRPLAASASVFIPCAASLTSLSTPSPPPGLASAVGGASARTAWHREQFRLYAMGRMKALRTGGQGYWAGQGFELD